MKSLKNALISPHLFTLPNITGHTTLDTDACDVQIRCILRQHLDYITNSYEYYSRSLTNSLCVYNTTQLECFAIVGAVLQLQHYLEETQFTMRTEHKSLMWILNSTDSTGILARSCIRNSEFDFDTIRRVGVNTRLPMNHFVYRRPTKSTSHLQMTGPTCG